MARPPRIILGICRRSRHVCRLTSGFERVARPSPSPSSAPLPPFSTVEVLMPRRHHFPHQNIRCRRQSPCSCSQGSYWGCLPMYDSSAHKDRRGEDAYHASAGTSGKLQFVSSNEDTVTSGCGMRPTTVDPQIRIVRYYLCI